MLRTNDAPTARPIAIVVLVLGLVSASVERTGAPLRPLLEAATAAASTSSAALGGCSGDSSGADEADARPPLIPPATGWTRIASVPYTGSLNAGVGFAFDDLAVDAGSLAVLYREQFIHIEDPKAITVALKKATVSLRGGAPVVSTTHFDDKNNAVFTLGTVRAHFVDGLAFELSQSVPLSNRAASQFTELDESGAVVTTVAAPEVVAVNTTFASNHAIAMGAAYLNGAQGHAGLFAFAPSQGWPEVPATLANYDPRFEANTPDALTVAVGGLLPFFASDLTPRAAALLSDGRFVVLKPDFQARELQTELTSALPQYAYHPEDLRSTVYAHIVGYGKSGNTHSFLVSEHVYDTDVLTPISLYRWTEGAASLEKVYSVPESLSTHGDIEVQKPTGRTHVFEIDGEGRAYLGVSDTQSEVRQISKDGDAVLSKTGSLALATGNAPAYLSRVYEHDGARYVVAYTFTHPNTAAEDLRLEIYRYDP